MKRFLPLLLLSLMAVAPATAQGPRHSVPLENPIRHIVVNGHGNLFLSLSRDSISHIRSRNPEKLSYTYTPDNGGTITIDSGSASLWLAPFHQLSIKTSGYASVSLMPGDTLRADNIDILAHDYSKINITRPVNSDTLKAYSFEHAFIAFDALEGFEIDLSDQGYSHINIDRRSLLVKKSQKKRKKVFGLF